MEVEEEIFSKRFSLSMRSKILIVGVCYLITSVFALFVSIDEITYAVFGEIGEDISDNNSNEKSDGFLANTSGKITFLWDSFESFDDYWHLETEGTGSIKFQENDIDLIINETPHGTKASFNDGEGGRDERWLYGSMQTQLKMSGNEDDCSYSWGFGAGQHVDEAKDVLCFTFFPPRSGPDLAGFRILIIINEKPLLVEPVNVNLRDWHTYAIHWEPDNVTFLIDDKKVFTTNQVPHAPMHIGAYISNAAFEVTDDVKWLGTDDTDADEWIQIDYIQVFMKKAQHSEYVRDAERILLTASQMIQAAESQGLVIDNFDEYLTAATKALEEDGYILGELYTKVKAVADLSSEDLEVFAQLFLLATEKLQSKTDSKNQTALEANYLLAQTEWNKCNFEVTENYLQLVIRG